MGMAKSPHRNDKTACKEKIRPPWRFFRAGMRGIGGRQSWQGAKHLRMFTKSNMMRREPCCGVCLERRMLGYCLATVINFYRLSGRPAPIHS